uniref:Rab-GAP TBC domain-containing protein n=1 Tax=Haptolina ericina TaxID=156174 RepID=A0A7S3AS00_9EUKA
MCEFAKHYCRQNPDIFADEDSAYVLGFSVIMLNTDAHSSQVRNRMTKPQFVRNNRGINNGEDLPQDLLESVYDDIVNKEIKTGTEFDDLAESELMNWLQQGTVFKKYAYGRVSRDPYHQCRLWIRTTHLCWCNLQARGRRERTVPLDEIEEVIVGASTEVFRRNVVDTHPSEGALCFSLVFGGRTLDLQASTPDETTIWTRYFIQVVERTQLEAHARRIALRAQPREDFFEIASAVWEDEILPDWEDERSKKRTILLWWEGVPSALRGKVWRRAIGDPMGLGAASFASHCAATTGEDQAMAVRSVAHELQRIGSVSLELNLFTSQQSPMQLSLLKLVAATRSYARSCQRELPANVSFLAAMLLLYLDESDAFVCLANMLSLHHLGWRHNQLQWRLEAADHLLQRELPDLAQKFLDYDVPLSDILPTWMGSMLTSTLPLDLTARVWDCYLRDGEFFLWRAMLELMRLLTPAALEATTAAELRHVFEHARHSASVSEKSLFHSIGSNEAAMHEWLKDFSQKLPLPSAERVGTCFDMWTNCSLCEEAQDHRAEGEDMSAREDDEAASELEGAPGTALTSAEGSERQGRRSLRDVNEMWHGIPCSHAFT